MIYKLNLSKLLKKKDNKKTQKNEYNQNNFLDVLNNIKLNELNKIDTKQKQLIFFNFLKLDLTKDINYKTNKEEITDSFKYTEILSKLKLFSQLILLNINNKNINLIVNNNITIREQIFNFSNYFYKKTIYHKIFLLIYKQSFINNINILTINDYLIKLTRFINFIITKQLIKNLNKEDLHQLICKVIFYTSIIIFYLKNKYNLINNNG